MGAPNVTATISANDKATAVLSQFAKSVSDIERAAGRAQNDARNLSGVLSNMSGRNITSAADAASRLGGNFDRANRHAREHLTLLQRMHRELSGLSTLSGIYAGNLLRRGVEHEKRLEDELTRMRAFTNVDADTVDLVRQSANARGVKWKGGAVGHVQAANALLRSGLNDLSPDDKRKALPELATMAQQYADLNKVSNIDDAATQALQFTAQIGAYRDKTTGETLDFTQYAKRHGIDEATRIFRDTMGTYLRIANIMPGKETDIFGYFKNAGPTLQQLKVPLNEQVALMYGLALGGTTGELAGQHVRGMYQRGTGPSAVALDAGAAMGIDVAKHVKFDPRRVDPKGVVDAIHRRFGDIGKVAEAAIIQNVEAWKARGGTDVNELNKIVTDAIAQNVKNPKGIIADRYKMSAWVQKSLFASASGFDLWSLLEDLAEQDKRNGIDPDAGAAIGFYKKYFGADVAISPGALSLQNIKALRSKIAEQMSNEAYGGITPGEQWDKAMNARLESFGSQLDQTGERVKAFGDRLFQAIEPLIKGSQQKGNDLLGTAVDNPLMGAAAGGAGLLGLIGVSMLLRRMPFGGAIAGGALGAGTGYMFDNAVTGATIGYLLGRPAAGAGFAGATAAAGATIAAETAAAVAATKGAEVGLAAGATGKTLPMWLKGLGVVARTANPILTGLSVADIIYTGMQELGPEIAKDAGLTMGERARKHRAGRRYGELLRESLDEQYAERDMPWRRDTSVKAWPGSAALGDTANQKAQAVTVYGEASVQNEITVRAEPTERFWIEVQRRIGSAAMTMRDKTGTSNGGSTGTTQPMISPAPGP